MSDNIHDSFTVLEIGATTESTSITKLDGNQAANTVAPKGNGLGWMVLAAVMWGTTGVSSALLNRVEVTPPLWIGFLRLGLASPFLLGLTWLFTRRNPFRLTRREWQYYTMMGLAMALYQVTYFLAIPLASVTLVVVVALCSSPLIVAFISIPVFKERLTRRLVTALALSLTGTALLAFGGGQPGEAIKPEYLLGALLALVTGFGYSLFLVCSKLASRLETVHGGTARGSIQPIAVAFTIGALVLLGIAMLTGSVRLEMQPGVWAIAAYLGWIPTGVAYIVFLKGISRTSATAAAIMTLLEPSVAALLAWALLGEQLSLASLVGSILLLGSVFLLNRR